MCFSDLWKRMYVDNKPLLCKWPFFRSTIHENTKSWPVQQNISVLITSQICQNWKILKYTYNYFPIWAWTECMLTKIHYRSPSCRIAVNRPNIVIQCSLTSKFWRASPYRFSFWPYPVLSRVKWYFLKLCTGHVVFYHMRAIIDFVEVAKFCRKRF